MPFSIELTPYKGVSIKVKVTNTNFTFYFKGPTPVIREAMEAWTYLEKQFIKEMPGYNRRFTIGPKPVHLKRNHTNELEMTDAHFHTEFNSEITPDIFTLYFKNIFEQQAIHKEAKYHFIRAAELGEMVENFAIYYQEYKGSRTEEIYNEATTLTFYEESDFNEARKNAAFRNMVEHAKSEETLFGHSLKKPKGPQVILGEWDEQIDVIGLW